MAIFARLILMLFAIGMSAGIGAAVGASNAQAEYRDGGTEKTQFAAMGAVAGVVVGIVIGKFLGNMVAGPPPKP